MREVKAFWLLSAVFVLVCVGILLFSHLNMERESVYFVSADHFSQAQQYEQETPSEDLKSKNIDKININSASIGELIQLPGIGEKIAEAIVAYREEHGEFGSIEEIMEVSGIGEGKFNNIKAYITVQQ